MMYKKFIKYSYPAIIIILSILCFAWHIARAEEGPVYNFNFTNSSSNKTPESKVPAKKNHNKEATKSILSREDFEAKKTWGPQLGFFMLAYEDADELRNPFDDKYEPGVASGYSIGLKLPLTSKFALIPQFKLPRNDFSGRRLALRMDLNWDYHLNPRFSLAGGFSGVMYRTKFQHYSGTYINSGLGIYAGPNISFNRFLISALGRLEYLGGEHPFVTSGSIGYGICINFGLRI